MPLNIVVVGAGIAGLSAAVSLRQAGHTVTVFEKSKFAVETGAALLLVSNGTRVLSRLGFSFERARGQHFTAWETLDGRTLANIGSLDLTDAEKRYGAPLMCVHRVDLHKELLRLASAEDTNARKVQLHLNSAVIDARPEKGEIELADGSVHKADLIVAADGLHSVLKRVALGSLASISASTGISAFRFLIETRSLMNDPQLVEFLSRKCKGPTILADTQEVESERHIVWYDCQGGDVQNLVGMLPFGGQGSNQAIEDAGALGYLLEGVETAAEIPKRLELFETVRRKRASRVQILSKKRVGKEGDVQHELEKHADPPGSGSLRNFLAVREAQADILCSSPKIVRRTQRA
ncbi:MAG: hypothetical protein Q9201_005964 [Fulgogasparrea decipioides]